VERASRAYKQISLIQTQHVPPYATTIISVESTVVVRSRRIATRTGRVAGLSAAQVQPRPVPTESINALREFCVGSLLDHGWARTVAKRHVELDLGEAATPPSLVRYPFSGDRHSSAPRYRVANAASKRRPLREANAVHQPVRRTTYQVSAAPAARQRGRRLLQTAYGRRR